MALLNSVRSVLVGAPFAWRQLKMKKPFFLLLLLLPVLTLAQVVPATNIVPTALHALTAVGNVQTVQPVLNDLGNFTKMSYQTGALGDVITRSKSLVPVAGHDPLVIDVVAKIPKTSVIAAFGKFAVKNMPLINTASALYELASDLGFKVTNTEGTAPQFSQVTGGTVCAAPTTCYEYSIDQVTSVANVSGSPARAVNYVKDSQANVCKSIIGRKLYGDSANVLILTSVAYYDGCTGTLTGGYGFTKSALRRVVPPYDTTSATPVPIETVQAAINAKTTWAESNPLARMIVEAIKLGDSLSPGEVVVTGPASSPATTTTTVNNIDNTTTTTTNQNQYTYAGNQITTNNVTNNSTVNNVTGAVTNSTTSSSTVINSSTPAAPKPVPEKDTCGMPGTPPCKIDESGTPAVVADSAYNSKTDAAKADALAARTTMAGTADKPFFSGWSVLFSAPAVAACSPIVLPGFQGGASMGSLDPCPVVDGVRYVMGLIWAMAGVFFSLKMIKEVV